MTHLLTYDTIGLHVLEITLVSGAEGSQFSNWINVVCVRPIGLLSVDFDSIIFDDRSIVGDSFPRM